MPESGNGSGRLFLAQDVIGKPVSGEARATRHVADLAAWAEAVKKRFPTPFIFPFLLSIGIVATLFPARCVLSPDVDGFLPWQ